MKSYLQLFLKSLQTADKRADKSTVVAFTASQPGEGVSYVAASFGVELARKTRRRTLIADLDALQRIDVFHYSRITKFCYQTTVRNLYVLPPKEQLALAEEEEEDENCVQLQPKSYENEIERGVSNLQTLRFVFDFVLLDCPSLQASGDAALFVEAANGVIVVVEAERTRQEQLRNTLRTIEMAKGNLLGCVLNKRQYPVPEWLYRRI
jgi:Mrp family chromosome partitioning ATPase